MWRNIKFVCNLYYTCLHVCVCVCVSVCVCMCKSWKLCTFMKDTLYLDAEIEKKKSTGVKYTMLFELNFRLDLLRFHKECLILSWESKLSMFWKHGALLDNKCLFWRSCKNGFYLWVVFCFFKWAMFCCVIFYLFLFYSLFYKLENIWKIIFFQIVQMDLKFVFFLNFLWTHDFVQNCF